MIVIPYKIDMGSEGNMPLFIFKKNCSKIIQKSNCKNP